MMGMFRWRAGDKTRFFEFLLLEEDAQGVAMRFKHVGPGWKPWEKNRPLSFRVSMDRKARAVFSNVVADQSPKRVVYELSGKDRLDVSIESTRGGKPETSKLAFHRKAPAKK